MPNLASLKKHPELLNFDYGFKGSEVNKPNIAFDDGSKTYFRFVGEVPGIFLVLPDRSETLINYRREGDLIVVDKTAAQWTLRNGAEATCVFNLDASAPPPPRDQMTLVDSAAAAPTSDEPPTIGSKHAEH